MKNFKFISKSLTIISSFILICSHLSAMENSNSNETETTISTKKEDKKEEKNESDLNNPTTKTKNNKRKKKKKSNMKPDNNSTVKPNNKPTITKKDEKEIKKSKDEMKNFINLFDKLKNAIKYFDKYYKDDKSLYTYLGNLAKYILEYGVYSKDKKENKVNIRYCDMSKYERIACDLRIAGLMIDMLNLKLEKIYENYLNHIDETILAEYNIRKEIYKNFKKNYFDRINEPFNKLFLNDSSIKIIISPLYPHAEKFKSSFEEAKTQEERIKKINILNSIMNIVDNERKRNQDSYNETMSNIEVLTNIFKDFNSTNSELKKLNEIIKPNHITLFLSILKRISNLKTDAINNFKATFEEFIEKYIPKTKKNDNVNNDNKINDPMTQAFEDLKEKINDNLNNTDYFIEKKTDNEIKKNEDENHKNRIIKGIKKLSLLFKEDKNFATKEKELIEKFKSFDNTKKEIEEKLSNDETNINFDDSSTNSKKNQEYLYFKTLQNKITSALINELNQQKIKSPKEKEKFDKNLNCFEEKIENLYKNFNNHLQNEKGSFNILKEYISEAEKIFKSENAVFEIEKFANKIKSEFENFVKDDAENINALTFYVNNNIDDLIDNSAENENPQNILKLERIKNLLEKYQIIISLKITISISLTKYFTQLKDKTILTNKQDDFNLKKHLFNIKNYFEKYGPGVTLSNFNLKNLLQYIDLKIDAAKSTNLFINSIRGDFDKIDKTLSLSKNNLNNKNNQNNLKENDFSNTLNRINNALEDMSDNDLQKINELMDSQNEYIEENIKKNLNFLTTLKLSYEGFKDIVDNLKPKKPNSSISIGQNDIYQLQLSILVILEAQIAVLKTQIFMDNASSNCDSDNIADLKRINEEIITYIDENLKDCVNFFKNLNFTVNMLSKPKEIENKVPETKELFQKAMESINAINVYLEKYHNNNIEIKNMITRLYSDKEYALKDVKNDKYDRYNENIKTIESLFQSLLDLEKLQNNYLKNTKDDINILEQNIEQNFKNKPKNKQKLLTTIKMMNSKIQNEEEFDNNFNKSIYFNESLKSIDFNNTKNDFDKNIEDKNIENDDDIFQQSLPYNPAILQKITLNEIDKKSVYKQNLKNLITNLTDIDRYLFQNINMLKTENNITNYLNHFIKRKQKTLNIDIDQIIPILNYIIFLKNLSNKLEICQYYRHGLTQYEEKSLAVKTALDEFNIRKNMINISIHDFIELMTLFENFSYQPIRIKIEQLDKPSEKIKQLDDLSKKDNDPIAEIKTIALYKKFLELENCIKLYKAVVHQISNNRKVIKKVYDENPKAYNLTRFDYFKIVLNYIFLNINSLIEEFLKQIISEIENDKFFNKTQNDDNQNVQNDDNQNLYFNSMLEKLRNEQNFYENKVDPLKKEQKKLKGDLLDLFSARQKFRLNFQNIFGWKSSAEIRFRENFDSLYDEQNIKNLEQFLQNLSDIIKKITPKFKIDNLDNLNKIKNLDNLKDEKNKTNNIKLDSKLENTDNIKLDPKLKNINFSSKLKNMNKINFDNKLNKLNNLNKINDLNDITINKKSAKPFPFGGMPLTNKMTSKKNLNLPDNDDFLLNLKTENEEFKNRSLSLDDVKDKNNDPEKTKTNFKPRFNAFKNYLPFKNTVTITLDPKLKNINMNKINFDNKLNKLNNINFDSDLENTDNINFDLPKKTKNKTNNINFDYDFESTDDKIDIEQEKNKLKNDLENIMNKKIAHLNDMFSMFKNKVSNLKSGDAKKADEIISELIKLTNTSENIDVSYTKTLQNANDELKKIDVISHNRKVVSKEEGKKILKEITNIIKTAKSNFINSINDIKNTSENAKNLKNKNTIFKFNMKEINSNERKLKNLLELPASSSDEDEPTNLNHANSNIINTYSNNRNMINNAKDIFYSIILNYKENMSLLNAIKKIYPKNVNNEKINKTLKKIKNLYSDSKTLKNNINKHFFNNKKIYLSDIIEKYDEKEKNKLMKYNQLLTTILDILNDLIKNSQKPEYKLLTIKEKKKLTNKIRNVLKELYKDPILQKFLEIIKYYKEKFGDKHDFIMDLEKLDGKSDFVKIDNNLYDCSKKLNDVEYRFMFLEELKSEKEEIKDSSLEKKELTNTKLNLFEKLSDELFPNHENFNK